MPANDPTRAVVEAARKLAACEHPTDRRVRILLTKTDGTVDERPCTWCKSCGTILIGHHDLWQPQSLGVLVDAVGEAHP